MVPKLLSPPLEKRAKAIELPPPHRPGPLQVTSSTFKNLRNTRDLVSSGFPRGKNHPSFRTCSTHEKAGGYASAPADFGYLPEPFARRFPCEFS